MLYRASTGVQYPQNGETVNGGQAVEQSDSEHYVYLRNDASGQQQITFSYRMKLFHDSETTPHSTKAATDASVTLNAGQSYTVAAELSKTLSIPTGAHVVRATADIRPGGLGEPWTVSPDHTHNYQRDN